MKRPFGLGVGLAVLTCLPDPASAQAVGAPQQAVYYPQTVPYFGNMTYYVVSPSGPAIQSGDTRDTMRRLWDDHVLLTRFFLLSSLADLQDKETAFLRLAKHQSDIGNAVKSVLGEAAGEKLTALLKDRVQIAADLIAANKANDSAKKADMVKKLQANSDDIGTFLTGVNPQAWPDQVVKGVLREHTDLLISAIDARVRQDWNADMTAFEKSRAQIRLMADLMANGLGAPTATTIPTATTMPVQQTTSGRRFRR
jgi:hypothetical protein